MADAPDPMRWVWRGVTGGTLLFGWLFILITNKFHIDPPTVIVMLAFLAVVLAIANLWRVGAATVAETRADDWGRPLGSRDELEKEKKTLLKSIKEAEFDLAMGKLSKLDAEQLIQMYRARAIEVIKELDRADASVTETPREQIQRAVAARVALLDKAGDGSKKSKKKKKEAEGTVQE